MPQGQEEVLEGPIEEGEFADPPHPTSLSQVFTAGGNSSKSGNNQKTSAAATSSSSSSTRRASGPGGKSGGDGKLGSGAGVPAGRGSISGGDLNPGETFDGSTSTAEEEDLLGEVEPRVTKVDGVVRLETLAKPLSFEKGFFYLVGAIEMFRQANPDSVLVMGIAGPVGAGKSMLAQRLVSVMGGVMVTMQSFIRPEAVGDNNRGDPDVTDFGAVRSAIRSFASNKYAMIPDPVDPTKKSRVNLPGEAPLVVLEGSYALHVDIRPHLNIAVAINGGVHSDLIKRIVRDIRKADVADDVMLEITDVVFPMYKAFVEPDLSHAHVTILNRHNPVVTMADPLYVSKAELLKITPKSKVAKTSSKPGPVSSTQTPVPAGSSAFERARMNAAARSNLSLSLLSSKPLESREWSDMYLYPPVYDASGYSRGDRRSWLRVRRFTDGRFYIFFYHEMMDPSMNVRPGINFPITIRVISGLLSLGYQIGAILHRKCDVLYEDEGVIVTKETIPELGTTQYIQVKGKDRAGVLAVSKSLGILKHHIPQTFLYLYFNKMHKRRQAARVEESSKSASKPTTSPAGGSVPRARL